MLLNYGPTEFVALARDERPRTNDELRAARGGERPQEVEDHLVSFEPL
jgi:hypothetical protein